VAGDRIALVARQELGAQAHEQDLDDAEVDQPERIAEGRDQNEDRETVRAEHMREYESLEQAGDKGGAGGGRPQQKEGYGDHAPRHVRKPVWRRPPCSGRAGNAQWRTR